MTPDQHNRFLGYSHLAYAAFQSLMGLFFGVMMIAVFSNAPSSSRGGDPPLAFFIGMACFFVVFTVGWSIPSMIAAYALLKRKRWAKVAGIVAGVFSASQMPVGTAVCVYTFWFLFSEPGRLLYDQPATTISAGKGADLTGILTEERKGNQYFPPAAPPDWR